jgi:hypothetical protein
MQNNKIEQRSRWFFYFAMIWLVYRFWGNTLFSNLAEPVLVYPSIDNIFWLFHWLNIPAFITQHQLIATVFDLLLFFFPILFIKAPNKWFAIAYTILITVYNIVFATYSAHHFHSLMGLIIISTTFWTADEARHQRLWEAARYYFLFVMASAALWKICRGSAFQPDQMVNILKAQHAQYFAEHGSTGLGAFYHYLIQNTAIAQGIYWLAIVLELAFLVGFFTKKFDKLLLLFFFAFITTNYFVMGIFSFELSVFGILLWL